MAKNPQRPLRQTSIRKVNSNRENSKKPTGPRTQAGKNIVRRNAVKHDLLSKIFAFETPDEERDFIELLAHLREELKPHGIIETMLVEEIVAAWWKGQAAQRWSLEQQVMGSRASIAVLRACPDLSRLIVNPAPNQVDNATALVGAGFECRELVIKVGPEKPEENRGPFSSRPKPDFQFEAKLGTSAEACLRYEAAWKRDLYRALEALHRLQETRKAKGSKKKTVL